MPETNYHIYCFAEDDWPADAMGATIRSQSYTGSTAIPNKVSLDDVLNFSDSAAGEFTAAAQLVHAIKRLRKSERERAGGGLCVMVSCLSFGSCRIRMLSFIAVILLARRRLALCATHSGRSGSKLHTS